MFLATTALEEFWDTKQEKILLAGEWCRLYGRDYSVEVECLPYLWGFLRYPEEKYMFHYMAPLYCALASLFYSLPFALYYYNEELNNKKK